MLGATAAVGAQGESICVQFTFVYATKREIGDSLKSCEKIMCDMKAEMFVGRGKTSVNMSSFRLTVYYLTAYGFPQIIKERLGKVAKNLAVSPNTI